MKNVLYAGDTLEFGLNVPQFPPSDGWTLKMRLTPRFTTPAQLPVVLTAAPNVSIGGETFDYAITATPLQTAEWKAGAYGWASWVEKAGARQVLEGSGFAGETTVLPDPATMAAGTDTRTPARKAYDDAQAALRTFIADKGLVAEYQIGDRRMKFRDPGEIRALITRLAVEVANEQRAVRLAKGLPDPRKIFVRARRG